MKKAKFFLGQHIVPLSPLVILAIALGVRVYGIRFGLPHIYHPDEAAIVGPVHLIVQTGDFNPHWFNWPSLYIYIQVFVYVARFLFGVSKGSYASLADVTLPGFYFWGRLVTALLGTFTVYVVYLIGRKMFDRETGLLAALFLALYFLHVKDSHYLTVDVPATFFVALSFFFSYLVLEKNETKHYILAGLIAGLAAATKYNAILVVIPLALAYVFRSLRDGVFGGKVWLGFFFAALGFFIGCPYSVLDLPTFLDGVAFDIYHYRMGHEGFEGSNNWLFYSRYLFREGVGPTLFPLTCGGVLLSFAKRREKDWLLLSFPLIYFVLLSTQKVNFVRNLLPILPFLAIFGAIFARRAATVILDQVKLARSLRIALIAIFLISVLTLPVVKALEFGYGCSQKSTRTLAAEWIEANIPKGSRIVIEDYAPPISGDFEVIGFRLQDHPLDFYAKEGFDYLVFSSGSYARFFKEPQKYPNQVEGYKKLFEKGILIKEFKADDRVEGFLSPTIKIFKVPKLNRG
ncbi:MAG: glycosyltransferase family 39 protein [Actinomycetota bacterium]|nr:glycosyltransferase family 39 protein [Actinomycetota bacterium]